MIRTIPVPRAALAAALALAAACGGGGSKDRGQPVGGPCSSRASCQSGLVCLAGKCATDAPAAPTCDPATSAPTVSFEGEVGPAADPGCTTAVQQAISAGAVPVGTFTVGTTTPAFAVPDGTVSFSIVSQAVSAPESVTLSGGQTVANWPVPWRVLAPGGRVFYDDIRDYWQTAPGDEPGLEAFYAGIVPGVGAFTTPNTSHGLDLLYSAGKLQPGAWSVVVGDLSYECAVDPRLPCDGSTTSSYDVTVIPKAGPIASTGTLDVSIYFVSESLSGATAWNGQAFGQFVASLQTLVRRLGLCLGQVKVYDLPAWARTTYSMLDVANGGRCGPLAQLSTLSQADESVHLFLVDGFVEGPGGSNLSLAGIDGSIAGPSGVPGTTTSGAAVGLGADLVFSGQCVAGDLDPAHCGPDSLAYVAAHEAGHWLGLFHTTESTGDLWDPLDDTGTCACSCYTSAADRNACAAGSKDLSTAQCLSATNASCQGGDNLMFWLFSPGNSSGRVSPQQGRVARLNPAVH